MGPKPPKYSVPTWRLFRRQMSLQKSVSLRVKINLAIINLAINKSCNK
jgi:hypothetical protein